MHTVSSNNEFKYCCILHVNYNTHHFLLIISLLILISTNLKISCAEINIWINNNWFRIFYTNTLIEKYHLYTKAEILID